MRSTPAMQDVACHALGKSDAYRVLKVSPGSSKAKIRQAYLDLMKRSHPDVSSEEDANLTAVALNAAYEELMQVLRFSKLCAK